VCRHAGLVDGDHFIIGDQRQGGGVELGQVGTEEQRASLRVQQPCWTNITDRAKFTQGSGRLPNMKTSMAPTRVENAYPSFIPGSGS
jgi:hypothetical protein